MPGPTNIKPSVPGMHGMRKVEEGPLSIVPQRNQQNEFAPKW